MFETYNTRFSKIRKKLEDNKTLNKMLQVMRVIIFDMFGNILQKFSCSRYLEFPNGVCSNGDKNEILISDNRAHCIKVGTFKIDRFCKLFLWKSVSYHYHFMGKSLSKYDFLETYINQEIIIYLTESKYNFQICRCSRTKANSCVKSEARAWPTTRSAWASTRRATSSLLTTTTTSTSPFSRRYGNFDIFI